MFNQSVLGNLASLVITGICFLIGIRAISRKTIYISKHKAKATNKSAQLIGLFIIFSGIIFFLWVFFPELL